MLWHISQVADEGCRVGGHNAAGHGELDVIGMDGLIMKDRELTKITARAMRYSCGSTKASKIFLGWKVLL